MDGWLETRHQRREPRCKLLDPACMWRTRQKQKPWPGNCLARHHTLRTVYWPALKAIKVPQSMLCIICRPWLQVGCEKEYSTTQVPHAKKYDNGGSTRTLVYIANYPVDRCRLTNMSRNSGGSTFAVYIHTTSLRVQRVSLCESTSPSSSTTELAPLLSAR